jgi:quinol monooxygenase YgiN
MSHKTVLVWACALVASWVSAQDTHTNNISETAATASLTAGGEAFPLIGGAERASPGDGLPRIKSLTLIAAAAASPQASAADGRDDVFHVAIFHFPKARLNEAVAAFRELASVSRRDPGNLGYDVYRGTDDDQAFYLVEHWASPASLAAHERTEAFIHLGQGVLVRYATLHDAVTGRVFDSG